MQFLEGYIVEKLLDTAIKFARTSLSGVHYDLASSAEGVGINIDKHLVEVKNWASETPFADLRTAKRTEKVFVQLDCYVIPRHRQVSRQEQSVKVPLASLIDTPETRHLVFLGTPGAGKTTSMRHLCLRLLTDDNFAISKINYPIVIRLRDLNYTRKSDNALLETLWGILGLEIKFTPATKEEVPPPEHVKTTALRTAICAVLNETRALLILDGFDELSSGKVKESTVQEIRALALQLESATLIVTSRTGDFPATIENTKTFEVCPLDECQITEFANRFFQEVRQATEFLTQIRASPFADSAIKPLTLAHLCALYERVGSIPDKPRTVYRKILHLLLEDWDEQRSVRRVSRYASFASDRKYDFLSAMAYKLSLHSKTVFSTDTICEMYNQSCHDFGLPESEAAEVARELESHTGLFLQCGAEQFEFIHKSIQEFLAAEFLVRLPSVPEDEVLVQIPNELAIATSISAIPSLYFMELLAKTFRKVSGRFLQTYTTRLLQEKPDFNSDKPTIYSLLDMCSILLQCSAKVEQTDSGWERLIGEMEAVIIPVLSKNENFRIIMLKEINFSYTSKPGIEKIGNDRVRTLLRLPTSEKLRDVSRPEKLLIRNKFYDAIVGLSRSGL